MLITDLINNILRQGDCHTGPSLQQRSIISGQKQLALNNFPMLPKDFICFLHHFNGLTTGGEIPTKRFHGQCRRQSFRLEFPRRQRILILGYDEYSYLAYNPARHLYQIIDKDTREVLQAYSSAAAALEHILKTNYEQYLY